AQNGNLDEAVAHFTKILDPKNGDPERGFDFTQDYLVINELGKTLFQRSKWEDDSPAARDRLLRRAVELFERTLKLDAEDVDAHEFLHKCFARLGGETSVPARPPAAGDSLLALTQKFLDSAEARSRRLDAARQISQQLDGMNRQKAPSLDVLLAVRRSVQTTSSANADPWLRLA